jgi:hypothetical protein
MEMPIEQTDLLDHDFVEFTSLSIRHVADVPTLEHRNIPGVKLDWTPLALDLDGLLGQRVHDPAHPSGSVGMVKLTPQYSSFLLGAWEEPAG